MTTTERYGICLVLNVNLKTGIEIAIKLYGITCFKSMLKCNWLTDVLAIHYTMFHMELGKRVEKQMKKHVEI